MFSVMSFNIRGSYHADGDNVWENRAQLNVQTILKYAPDLIGFQELTPGNQEYYEGKLVQYQSELGPRVSNENDKGIWEHAAIYWNNERFTKLDTGYYFLNETPEQYALHWGTEQGRALNWLLLYDNVANIEFVFMNTHFSHVSDEARIQSAKLICRRTFESFSRLPVILTGDFNTPPEHTSQASTPYRVFMAASFEDMMQTKRMNSAEPMHTFHNFDGENYHDIHRHIDWILYRDNFHLLNIKNAMIIRDANPPIYPSDHYPILATCKWESETT